MRARSLVEKKSRLNRESIVVTELPYQVNKARLLEKIAELVRDKKMTGIQDIRDESDREGMRHRSGTEKRRKRQHHPEPAL